MKRINQIIGSGLIARTLNGVDFGRPTLVLASGVSDSQETRAEAFCREADLVEQAITRHPGLHAVYCSTCSIDSGVVTPYTTHKLNMERLVTGAAASCHVFRLPQVVGLVHNRTLVSHFVDSILLDRVLKVQTRATRNLLDVRDFARVAALMVRSDAGAGGPQIIASATQVPVTDIVAEIARLLDRPARTEMQVEGYSQVIATDFLRGQLPADDPLFDPGHWRVILQHYVPLMAREVMP
ncbi:MAG: hypothetical protein KJ614_07300 [Gammaproteobacteria bacterium]|uniref:NAD-dependent epimerase/dehydratase family protein n=1 Tax=Rhodoferax sp. TaxID=50421 RepID=UPI001819D4B2|nr:NAD-dependent epimerase/dehydratase family protein [Rhodoferax sp.]MBU3898722.1 hypothetical protein [Gammaproteobacteria bacterium]MBA3056443.1 NAD(P)-dependent oxidoreductase [Rhodoferax sp.]MBU3997226.1 hypothetical protein [Gammaproteobacteria bacterium]MBU4080807.1 hypothetical protein [Gammaproteobacteria bacterium]MBU4112452.1 hypothetical protein [Gammaproteobacteria bacterium]